MKGFLRRLLTFRSIFGAGLWGLLFWALGSTEGDYLLAIDPGTAAILAATIGAGGSLGSSLLGGGGDAEFDLERQPISGIVPGADPLLALLQRQALIQQGGDPSQLGNVGAPILRFLEFPRTQGPFTADFNTPVFQNAATAISRIIEQGVAQGLDDAQILQQIEADPNVANQFQGFRDNAAVGAGFSSFEDLVGQQIKFQRERPEEAARASKQLETIRAGQDARTQGISQLLQDFPVPTQARIDELAGGFTEDLRRQRLREANVIGSPADLRNIEREGLLQAVGLLGGQQQLAGTALSAFRGDQTASLLQALGVQERGQAAQLAAGELAGAQSRAFAELGNRTDLANLQSEINKQNQQSDFFGSLLGAGVGLGSPAPTFNLAPAVGDKDD